MQFKKLSNVDYSDRIPNLNPYMSRCVMKISQETGYNLDPIDIFNHANRMCGLLRQPIEHYVKALSEEESPLWDEFLESLLMTPHAFFTDSAIFEKFEGVVLNELVSHMNTYDPIRILVVGCGKGEDVYSMAMIFQDKEVYLPNLKLQIIGIEYLSAQVSAAVDGCYGDNSFIHSRAHKWQSQYFKSYGTQWRISDEIRQNVIFHRMNILAAAENLGSFHCIMCQFMMPLLTPQHREEVLSKCATMLYPQGFLMLGLNDSILGLSSNFKLFDGCRGIYQKFV